MLVRNVKLLTFVIIFLVQVPVWASDKSETILVLGDSLSAGYGIDIKKGWVNLLQTRLKSTSGYQVVNASVSGETSGGGLARLPALLQEHQPALIIVELGGNDGLRGQPINIMQKNLESIVQQAQDAEAQVLLLGMKIPPNYGQRYTQLFAQSFVKIAEKYRLPFVPFFLEGVAGTPELVQGDGIHPRAEAQTILLDNVWPTLESLLQTDKKS